VVGRDYEQWKSIESATVYAIGKVDREVKGVCMSMVLFNNETHRDSGTDTIKDGANSRSNESERHKRQALADDKKGYQNEEAMHREE